MLCISSGSLHIKPIAMSFQLNFLARQLLSIPTCPSCIAALALLSRNWGTPKPPSKLAGAIALRPDYSDAHYNLANALKDLGQLGDAIAAYRQAISLRSSYPEAYNNLAIILKDKGLLDDAIAAYRHAIALRPGYPEAHNNLGIALREKGLIGDAIAAYRQSISLRPGYAEAHNNLGLALKGEGSLDDVIGAYRRAISLRPDYAEAYNNLGIALDEKGQVDDAIAAYRQAIRLRPAYGKALSNLGNALQAKQQLDEAIICHREAVASEPDLPAAHNNLGNVLKETGQINEALTAYKQAAVLSPDSPGFHSNFIFTLHYQPAHNAVAVADAHHEWEHRHADPLRHLIRASRNDRTADRRLRIGYVSADYGEHPVGRFLRPLLTHHDRGCVEVFCYSGVSRADAITQRLRQSADHWRDIAGIGDQLVAEQVRDDGIDILVDLSGHTAGNRLLVFARKPAPVQVSYLGYPSTTGLQTIDYRLTDAFADPPGLTERIHSETLIRLPYTTWCFAEPSDAPAVGGLPALRRGCVTFGSFNNLAKVTEPMLHLWAKILNEVPNSRLLLKAAGLASDGASERIRAMFCSQGIDADRLELIGLQPDYASHLALYGEMDIALDTFPYNGATTSCDALWMGVPVITLAGESHVSRVGLSLLTNLRVPELIANNPGQYVALAAALGNDSGRLMALRGPATTHARFSADGCTFFYSDSRGGLSPNVAGMVRHGFVV